MSDTQNKQKSKKLLTILRISVAVIAIAIVIVICYREREDLKTTFLALSPAIFLLALLIFMLSNAIIAMRWHGLLKAQKIDISYPAALKIHFLGLFYNNIMVSSVGGDMLRIWYVTQHTHKRLEAGLSVFVDRVIGLATMLMMAAGFYFLFPVNNLNQQAANAGTEPEKTESAGGLMTMISDHKMLIIGLISAIFAFLVILMLIPKTRRFIISHLVKIASHHQRVKSAIVLYCSKPLVLIWSVFLTFCGQIIIVTGFWLVGRSMGIEAPAKYYFVFFPISWVIGALPISIGGIGVQEFGLAGLFVLLPQVTLEQGLALAFCQRLIFLLGSIPGILIHLMGAHLPKHKKDFMIDSSQDLQ